jgi:hypothetical protein
VATASAPEEASVARRAPAEWDEAAPALASAAEEAAGWGAARPVPAWGAVAPVAATQEPVSRSAA